MECLIEQHQFWSLLLFQQSLLEDRIHHQISIGFLLQTRTFFYFRFVVCFSCHFDQMNLYNHQALSSHTLLLQALSIIAQFPKSISCCQSPKLFRVNNTICSSSIPVFILDMFSKLSGHSLTRCLYDPQDLQVNGLPVEACWAHNPEVRGSKPFSATIVKLN